MKSQEVVQMKIVAIVGSIRKDSYNQKLAHYIQKRYQKHFDLEILNIKELPFYDQISKIIRLKWLKHLKIKCPQQMPFFG
jgi:NADPH-dependent FMN reductase